MQSRLGFYHDLYNTALEKSHNVDSYDKIEMLKIIEHMISENPIVMDHIYLILLHSENLDDNTTINKLPSRCSRIRGNVGICIEFDKIKPHTLHMIFIYVLVASGSVEL